MNKAFITYLHNKLQAGHLNSIHLDALPTSGQTRLDVVALDRIYDQGESTVQPSNDFLFGHLLEKNRFQLKINFNHIDFDKLTTEREAELTDLADQLNAIYNQKENDFLEHGTRTFGFGYPLVTRRRTTATSQVIKAPLFIWSLDIKRSESNKNQWVIEKSAEAPIHINEALLSHLSDEEQLQLESDMIAFPENNLLQAEELEKAIEIVLHKLGLERVASNLELLPCPEETLVEKEAKPIIQIYWSGVLGVFSTQKQSIVKDIESLLEQEEYYNFDNQSARIFRKSLQTGVPIDPSQEGIIQTLEDQPFKIVQGPPGTGKSQALTAIITNILENEGKILVVCEKKTALQVIYNNLKKLGLEHLAVLVDDVDRDRKPIVHTVRQVADLVKPKYQRFNERNYESKLKRYNKLVKAFNIQHQHLLQSTFRDYDVKELVTDYLRYKTDSPNQEIFLDKMGFELSEVEFDYLLPYIEDAGDLFGEIDARATVFDGLGARLFTNPIYSIKNEGEMFSRIEQEKKFLLEAGIAELPTASQPFDLVPFGAAVRTEFDFKHYRGLMNKVQRAKEFWQTRYDLLLKLNQHIEHISIIRPNGFFKKVKRLSSFYQKIFTHLKTLDELQVQFTKLEVIVSKLPEDLTVNTLKYSSSAKAMKLFSNRYKLIDEFWQKAPIHCLTINKIINKSRFTAIDSDLFEEEKITVPRLDDIHYITKQLDDCIANRKYFKIYFKWRIFYEAAPELVQECIHQLRAVAKPEDWEAIFCYNYFYLLIDQETARIGEFNTDSKVLHRIIGLQEELQRLQKRKILKIWEARQQNSIKGFNRTSNIKWLFNHRKNSKYSRKNSLRNILHEEFDLFTDLFPVVLVSPTVCSSILPLRRHLFEVVLFDEASQLRLEDTYAALLRGKIKVISGDEHQMPPVDYFEGNQVSTIGLDILQNNTGEDNAIYLAESESLLEFGNNLNPNQTHTSFLDFHYRSHHPYLIAFSNAAFYGSRLVSLPQKRDYTPIDFVHLAEGAYTTEQTNPVEAYRILNYLKEDYQPLEDGTYPSLGIATFNKQQRNLIKNLIHELSIQEDAFRHKMEAIGKQEEWFVKSLENVQGDERDVILLSTTFAPNDQGSFDENFGWLNAKKGYRLLNVIITRAQQKITIFSSIPAAYFSNYTGDIIEKGNRGKGILYAYLSYCKAVSEGDTAAIINILGLVKSACQEDSLAEREVLEERPFEQEIQYFLETIVKKGCLLVNYRMGDYYLDFVLVDPITKQPLLALECDGAIWHSDDQAYIHDIHRQKVLEQYGIEVYRIWAMAWWPEPTTALDEMKSFLMENYPLLIQ